MIVLVNWIACNSKCNQLARVEHITSNKQLVVHLLGDDSEHLVRPCDIVGLKINDELTIKFEVTETVVTTKGS